jgi:hypothetical protein
MYIPSDLIRAGVIRSESSITYPMLTGYTYSLYTLHL